MYPDRSFPSDSGFPGPQSGRPFISWRRKDTGIEAVPRKGYHMVETPDVVCKEEILSLLETKWAGRNLVYLETVDSTNDLAKKLADQGAPEGTLVVADEQTGGKGRRGRAWCTPKGSAIAMTIVLQAGYPPGAGLYGDAGYGTFCGESHWEPLSRFRGNQMAKRRGGQRQKDLRHSDRDERGDDRHPLSGYRYGHQHERGRVS